MNLLIAGIGNIFMGDDAFGCEVARVLAEEPVPQGVQVRDFGTRALDLTYALMDGCDAAILIDLAPRGGAPGALYVIDPEVPDGAESSPMGAHDLDPVAVLRTCAKMGARCQRVLIVGCEPGKSDGTPLVPRMCSAVREAVRPAAALARSLIARLASDPGFTTNEKGDPHGIQQPILGPGA